MPAEFWEDERTGPLVLSTVVLNWNRADLLQRCLESYLATVGVRYELIVIDNGSSDDSRAVIDAVCQGKPHHQAVFLDENRGGEALNVGIERCRGRYIHISENDIEYLPGWDVRLLKKLQAFPEIGQISPHTPFHRAEEGEIWEDQPASRRTRDGMTVYIAERGITTTCLAPVEIYQGGASWTSKGSGNFRFPRDGRFSAAVKAMGFEVAWNDVALVNNLGHRVDEMTKRLPYYLENYAAKRGKGVAGFERRLHEHGYRLVQEADGAWTIRKS